MQNLPVGRTLARIVSGVVMTVAMVGGMAGAAQAGPAATMTAAASAHRDSGRVVVPKPAPQPGSPTVFAARSVNVTLINVTSSKLTRVAASLAHGIWTNNQLPPESIPAFSQGGWQSESNGFLTGTEGAITYESAFGFINITWDNPFVGSNEYSCTFPGRSCEISGGGGNNAEVKFIVF